ncbi:MAG: uroporphyrinogen decarboxylase family protein [Caldilineaceae bacterium]
MCNLSDTAQLALDTLLQKPVRGIPAWLINPMEWVMIDRLAGEPAGTYQRAPAPTYRKMLINSGCCLLDQWIPENPLTLGPTGFEAGAQRKATTGAELIVLDQLRIDSPEAAVEHLERVEFPRMRSAITTFDQGQMVAEILAQERTVQTLVGPSMLKAPYAYVKFPHFRYSQYGYENYFMAYALYPDVIERDFALQADLAVLHNRAFVQACQKGNLPPFIRLDHDMAGSRGMLVNIRSLERIWFPHFVRCLAPVQQAGVRMIWHCDGNLSVMAPRLLDVGLHGFQGFQYEDGMDYGAICRMKTREGAPLLIIAGVSVTRTLPYGTPDAVRQELKWLVENGPANGLFLGASSSITPGVPWENLQALVEGFHYYREHGR